MTYFERIIVAGALLMLFACEKENFDSSTVTENEQEPTVTTMTERGLQFELIGLDTLSKLLDSTMCHQVDPIFWASSIAMQVPNEPNYMLSWNFTTDGNPALLPLQSYELDTLSLLGIIWGASNDTTANYLWTGDQLDVTVEFTESFEAVDPISGPVNMLSGFMNGTMTDAEGQSYSINATFNKIVRHSY